MSHTGFHVPIDQIVVNSRIRDDYHGDDWPTFKSSFLTVSGQMQPIIVMPLPDGRYELKMGERRYRAISEHYAEGKKIINLPDGQIWAATRESLPRMQQLLLEWMENEQREGFNFVEKAKFIRNFHDEMVEQYGLEQWKQEHTAHTLKLSPASISHYLRVEQAVKDDPAVAKALTLNAAVKRMKTAEKLKVRHEQAKGDENDSFQRATNILHHGDAREWIKTIDDGSIDLINFDPPWGDNVSFKSQENHEGFDDSSEYASTLLHALLPELYRVLKTDRFCVFWFRAWAEESMVEIVKSYGFNLDFNRSACIWYKPDKITDQNRNPEKDLNEGYEKFFLLRKGDPLFHTRRGNNVFAYDRVPVAQVIHPTEKPIDLCRDILSLCSVPGEQILDPTSGSSAFLDAALRNNRKAQGAELSKTYWERGVTRLAEYLKTFSEA